MMASHPDAGKLEGAVVCLLVKPADTPSILLPALVGAAERMIKAIIR